MPEIVEQQETLQRTVAFTPIPMPAGVFGRTSIHEMIGENLDRSGIYAAIITGKTKHPIEGRVAEILEKIFEKTNKNFSLEELSLPEASFLEDFLFVLVQIFLQSRGGEAMLDEFISKFGIVDLARLLILARDEKIGDVKLARRIENALISTVEK
ncbi:MAG: hypothetical protein PHW24_01460 [Candidatus Moranbacteria bacterium]|nr:hypothetical protein [Candidatus Moranbacteria bacterium]